MKRIENVSRQVNRNFSRRGFLQGALASGVFVLGARFIPEPLWAAQGEAPAHPFEPSLWMSIASDGTVTIVAHRSEMGCGSRTALPLVVADELDADWSKVNIEQAIGDPKYGDQDTDGSHSVRSNFDLMRQVGATGRVMLITAAAAQWGVSPKDCTTEPHFVVHRANWTQARLWRNCRRCRQTPRSQKRRRPAQGSLRMALHRQRKQFAVRPSRNRHRQSNLWHGRDHARHGLCLRRASAGARAEDQILR